MNKKNKSLILFISIVSILLFQVVSISPYSVAVETSDALITEDWMSVTHGDFIDLSADPRENQVWISTGGKDLISFDNLGISNTETTDEILVYEAAVTFGFEMTLHTSVAFDDVFPDIDIDNIVDKMFFAVWTARMYPLGSWYNQYDVGYNDIILGEQVDHDYSGSIPLTVGFKTWTGKQPLTVNGVEISTPFYTADVSNVKTIDIRDGEVGGYEDVFVDSTGYREGTVVFTTSEDTPAETGDILTWLDGKNLGWTGSDTTYNVGIQQSVLTSTGGTYDNPNPATVKDFSFNVGTRIRPEVYRIKQDIEVRSAAISFEQELLGNWKLTVTQQPSIQMVKRTVGVHVVNQFIHWDFTVDMIVYASVENSAELSQSILDDPYLEMGDFIWDTGFVGTREVDVRVPDEPDIDWLILLVVILIVCVGLYVGYKIYKSSIQRRFMLQLAGRKT